MKSFLLVLSILSLSGCAHGDVHKNPSSQAGIPVSGDIVNASRLTAGGKLGLSMFKAGPQAEANEQLDRISLMLIKGIGERLKQSDSRLTITDDADKADLVLQGYIEEFSQPGRFDRWVKRQKYSRLSVSGEVWQRGSGTKVLTFGSSQKMLLKEQPLDAAFRMGEAIADFILKSEEAT